MGSFLGLPVFRGSVLSNLQGSFDILSSFFLVYSKAFLSLATLLISAVQRAHLFFIFLRPVSWVFFYGAFPPGSVISSTLYIGLLCLLRMHTLNSYVGDT